MANFVLWNDPVALRTFKLKDEQNNEYKFLTNNRTMFSLTFFELPKEITMENEAIKQWRNYFLDREIDISAPEYIKYASDIIRKFKLGKDELEMISREEKIEADYYAALEYAVEQGHQKGVEQGIKQGIKQGHQKGVEQGIKQGIEQGHQKGVEQGIKQGIEQGHQKGVEQGIKQGIEQEHQKWIETVKKLLIANIPMETICEVTGLSSKQIGDLK